MIFLDPQPAPTLDPTKPARWKLKLIPDLTDRELEIAEQDVAGQLGNFPNPVPAKYAERVAVLRGIADAVVVEKGRRNA